ncbi:hypothetical protein CCP3SC15_760003 [Gammaproteobacteria bacterium]
MKPALLLIDLQYDYLNRPELAPPVPVLLLKVAQLLTVCRAQGLPILHAHTRINHDGMTRMAHLKHNNIWWCVDGTPGAASPPEAEPLPGEAVFFKQGFNAFVDPELHAHLAQHKTDTLIVAGVHLHACVRETVLAAYQVGLRVLVIDDAVASYDLLHAEITREYLSARSIEFLTIVELSNHLEKPAVLPVVFSNDAEPAAFVNGRWLAGETGAQWERRNPACWDKRLDVVSAASSKQIDAAVAAAARSQRRWVENSAEVRAEYLSRFAIALAARTDLLVQAMVTEVGKPLAEARNEVARAVKLLHSAIHSFGNTSGWIDCAEGVRVRRAPLGVVAAVTPFNHPLAIAIGKLGPALALGNAVVWKPAPQAIMTTRLVIAALREVNLPDGLVGVVFGDGHTAQQLARHPQIAAVTVTASISAGRQLALICGAGLKSLQAELGGNNAVVVMEDIDPTSIARDLAISAFGFAGQRCTAGRRILVERANFAAMLTALTEETAKLCVGEPGDIDTTVGPLISRTQQQAVARAVLSAHHAGARILCGGTVPADLTHGCWYVPTLVTDIAPESPLFREETFGPVAVVHPFTTIEEAISLVNAVPHGLVATLYSHHAAAQRHFLTAIEAGVLKLNKIPTGVHHEVPFSGWKASGIGPPEHGRWDEEFYTRAQALYGFTRPIDVFNLKVMIPTAHCSG